MNKMMKTITGAQQAHPWPPSLFGPDPDPPLCVPLAVPLAVPVGGHATPSSLADALTRTSSVFFFDFEKLKAILIVAF